MVLKVAQALTDKFLLYEYAWHILVGLIVLAVVRTFSQGRTTSRERDLHNRTFLVTVCIFSLLKLVAESRIREDLLLLD